MLIRLVLLRPILFIIVTSLFFCKIQPVQSMESHENKGNVHIKSDENYNVEINKDDSSPENINQLCEEVIGSLQTQAEESLENKDENEYKKFSALIELVEELKEEGSVSLQNKSGSLELKGKEIVFLIQSEQEEYNLTIFYLDINHRDYQYYASCEQYQEEVPMYINIVNLLECIKDIPSLSTEYNQMKSLFDKHRNEICWNADINVGCKEDLNHMSKYILCLNLYADRQYPGSVSHTFNLLESIKDIPSLSTQYNKIKSLFDKDSSDLINDEIVKNQSVDEDSEGSLSDEESLFDEVSDDSLSNETFYKEDTKTFDLYIPCLNLFQVGEIFKKILDNNDKIYHYRQLSHYLEDWGNQAEKKIKNNQLIKSQEIQIKTTKTEIQEQKNEEENKEENEEQKNEEENKEEKEKKKKREAKSEEKALIKEKKSRRKKENVEHQLLSWGRSNTL